MANKGYHSYRGRRSGRNRLLVAALALLLVAACAYLFLQRYLRYTDDGGMYFALPFLEEREESPPPREDEPEREVELVIGDGSEEETPEEAEVYGERRLVGVSSLPEDSAALTSLLDQAGANGAVFTVRDNTGLARYTSTAALGDAVADDAMNAQALARLLQETEAVTVARFNCFHDSYYAWANMETAGLCQPSGYIWYDDLSYHWLDPAKEAARQYVIGLAVECAQLGFDELLLEEARYPATGNLEKIRYHGGAEGREDALVSFLTELREALEPYGTKISLLVEGSLLTAEGDPAYAETTGVDLSRLLPLVDAVYAETEDPDGAQAALEALAGEGEVPALVPLWTPAEDETETGEEDQLVPPEGNWYLP